MSIDGHDVSHVLVDDGYAINAMFERILLKLGTRLSKYSSIIVGMVNKKKVRSLRLVNKVVVSVRGVQTLI